MTLFIGHKFLDDKLTYLRYFSAGSLLLGIILIFFGQPDDGDEGLNEEVYFQYKSRVHMFPLILNFRI